MASLSSLFGYILNFIYGLVHNYGLAIIIFSILLKILLLPLSIKQHVTMKKTSKIQGKLKEIQDKYKNDQTKMNQEMMDLYKRENVSPFSGCLTSILQIVLLIAMFGLVRNPLTYMYKIDQAKVEGVKNYIVAQGETINPGYPQISIVKYVSKNKDKIIDLNEINKKEENTENNEENKEAGNIEENKSEEAAKEEAINEGTVENSEENVKNEINLNDLYINMDFIGLDLSNIPKENYQDWTVFIIPVLYVLTSIISMKLTTNMTKANKEEKDVIEVKKIENNNDDKKDEMSNEEMSEQMSKSMTWFMPIMSVSISMIAPLGLALYWLLNNALMIIERVVLNKVLKSEED